MKIGVGVTTTSRRQNHMANWYKISRSDLFADITKVYFANDVDGVAKAKNQCLRELSDCDYIFLFDDDCFPIKKGWEQVFIDAHNQIGCHHFSYLHNFEHVRKLGTDKGISTYNNSLGCMMFITKDVLERVGAYNESFGKYGYEHVEYSERIAMAKLSPARNICPDVAPDYIYSMDIDSWMRFDFKHHSTLTPDEMVKAEKIASDYLKSRDKEEIQIKL